MESVTAAGGVVFRKPDNKDVEVLLIFRRGVWDLPKGKIEDGESVKDCARREVAEEVGLENRPEVLNELSSTYHEYQREGINYAKTTHWFMMTVAGTPELSPQKTEGIELVEWTPLTEAQQKVGYQNIQQVLNEFKAVYLKIF